MAEERKPLDEKQVVARRKQIEDKKAELAKLEADTPKYYLGRPVTIIAETHPAREWTIRFDDTNETEVVQKFSVTDSPEDAVPVPSANEVRNEHFAKLNKERAEKNPKKVPPEATPTPTTKEWFKK